MIPAVWPGWVAGGTPEQGEGSGDGRSNDGGTSSKARGVGAAPGGRAGSGIGASGVLLIS